MSRFVIYLLLISLLSFTIATDSSAQASKFPVYDDQRISRPGELPQFEPEDFIVNKNRLTQYPDGFLYGDHQTLKKLSDFLLSDPAGRDLWKKAIATVSGILNQWDFDRKGFGADRYIYNVPQLEDLSMVYLFSGHKELGRFIHEHVMQIAELPYEFWLHAELRGYNPEYPLGMLETSSLCTTIAMVLSATAELYSPPEKARIEAALRSKALLPCLNWLDKPRKNNFTAVISSGAYVAAAYFHDRNGMAKALNAMTGYLDGSIERDGSYGEGTGYFGYPIRTLLPTILVMDHEKRKKVFSTSGLRYSATWKVYPYLYASDPDGRIQPTILHFGDNSYKGPTGSDVNIILAVLYQDPLASWLMDKFEGTWDFRESLLVCSFPGEVVEPQSPGESKLSLLKIFDNGDCFIRSTWEDNGIVLAMRSGDGSRINFSHQRPELSSIGLGAYGEYLIVSSGSASYRSPLHYQWDRATRSANTITVDDRNQLFPGSGKSSWNKTDVSGFWVEGQPSAEVVQYGTGKMGDYMVNETAKAYHVPMKHVRRTVLFVRDPGYFVMIDNMEAVNSQHKYTWRVHLNNRDGQGKINAINQNHWHFSRPLANLDIYLFSDKQMETRIGQGYMHGTTRDYSPGGINEGKPGSSVELEAFNPEKTGSMTFYSILYPSKIGTLTPSVALTDGKIVVGKDTLTFSKEECIIERAGLTETYKLGK